MINTHLDYQIPAIQVRQLKSIKELINKYGKDYPLVLTGDFNMELGNKNFDDFVYGIGNELEHVYISGDMWHGKNNEGKSLDHIFVSKDFDIENAGIISSMETSDHDVVYATVSRKR